MKRKGKFIFSLITETKVEVYSKKRKFMKKKILMFIIMREEQEEKKGNFVNWQYKI